MASSNSVPKAILYSYPKSVWSTVPRLCLYEKGYSDEEYVLKNVDLTKGENFAPSYLKINMNGTVPTLVVPTIESTGADVETRFRSLRDTITICDFLDQARGAHSTNTVSELPAPALAPATIEGKANSDNIIALVHMTAVDPNFLQLASQSKSELSSKASGMPGQMLKERQAALGRYLREAQQMVSDLGEKVTSHDKKMVDFLESKLAANSLMWELFQGQSGPEQEKAFFDASHKAWTEGVPEAFAKLETTLKGQFSLGDQVSLADLHLIAWFARIIDIAGGENKAGAYSVLEKMMGKKVGPKMQAYWDAWVERESFKRAYKEGLH